MSSLNKTAYPEINYIDEALSAANWNSNDTAVPQTVYDVIDFFSGCGGMSYGFHEIGRRTGMFRIIGAFDMDHQANLTYESNLGIKPCDVDLATAEIEQIKNIVQGMTSSDEKNPLIVIGCTPCQGFSKLNNGKDWRDPRNSLVSKFAKIIEALDPQIVVMENVPALLKTTSNRYFKTFLRTIRKAGYKQITAEIVNMAEYGVPQVRFRSIILASKDMNLSLPPATFEPLSFKTVQDAIGFLPPLKSGESWDEDPMHITSNHRRKTIDILKKIPPNGGSRPSGVGPACLDRVSGFKDVYGRLAWNRPSVTLTTRARTPSCGRFAHPDQHRGLSVREAALLQSFPPDYFFQGSFDNKFKQIGNAVPPAFSMRLAAQIASTTQQNRNRINKSTMQRGMICEHPQ